MASLTRTLLVVCPEGPALRVFTCVARFSGWSIGRAEVVELPPGALRPDAHSNVPSDLQPGVPPALQPAFQPAFQPEVIAAAVRAIVLRWSVPPGVEVALVLPAFVGGVLSLPGQFRTAGASVDMARLEMELAGRIPFAFRDIECEAQPGAIGSEQSIQVAWLPRTAAIEFRTAFARLGLVLGEIVFRPQLFARLLAAPGRGPDAAGTDLVIERWAGSCFFHLVAAGRVLRTSMAQMQTPGGLADRLQLELLSLGSEGPVATAVASTRVSRIVMAGDRGIFDREFEAAVKGAARGIKIERQATEISAMFLRFWRDGGTGVWLVPDHPPPVAMARRLAFIVAGCGVLLAAAMTWNTSAIRDEIAVLEAREARLRPQYQPLVDKERQTVAAAATADSVARLTATPGEAQAALLAVFNALPRSAWVTRFSFEEGKARVTGKGLDTESVMARLKDQPGVSRVAAASGNEPEVPDADAERVFRVGFHWAPAAPGAPGAAVPPVPPGSPGREITDGKKKGPQ